MMLQQLHDVNTLPSECGHGYGGMLFEEACRRMKAEGFENTFMFVLRENEKARRFYTAHSFAWDGTHAEIPFPPTPPALIFGM